MKGFADLSIKIYMTIVVIVSGGLSVVKGFRYVVNQTYPSETFPIIFYRQSLDVLHYSNSKTVYSILFITDAICDLINYVVFFAVNFVFDVLLLIKMRKTLAEKAEKIKNQVVQDERTKKKLDEFEEVNRRVLKIIIVNTFFNLCCKVPLSIVSVNDLRLLVKTPFESFLVGFGRQMFEVTYSMSVFCHSDQACLVFLSFGQVIFHFSSAVNIFFYKSFDRKFSSALENTVWLRRCFGPASVVGEPNTEKVSSPTS